MAPRNTASTLSTEPFVLGPGMYLFKVILIFPFFRLKKNVYIPNFRMSFPVSMYSDKFVGLFSQ